MSSMRIAMYSDAFFPQVSGVSTAVLNLSHALAVDGHSIFIQAPRPKNPVDTSFLHPNISLRYVNAVDSLVYPDFRLGTGLPLSLNAIQEFKPDLVHVHTFPMSIGLEGLFIAKALKVPAIQSFHTVYLHEDVLKIFRIHNPQLARIVAGGGWRLHKTMSRFFRLTIAPTHAVARELRRRHVPEPVTVVPNMLSEECFHLPKSPRRHLRRVLYVGRLSPEKRVDYVIDAFARAFAQSPDLELHIVGSGPERQSLGELAETRGIANRIQWHGKIAYSDLLTQRFYHQGDIFISLSVAETFGYTPLEAMAHGLPVIILDSPTNREVVDGGGILLRNFRRRDTLIDRAACALLESKDKPLKALRARAAVQANKFRPAVLLPEYEATYQSVLH